MTGCPCSVNDWKPCAYCAEDLWWEEHAEGGDPGPADCAWGGKFHCRVHCPTEQKEKRERPGLFATLAHWSRSLGDWLDPHAPHARDLRAEWRQQRADLDGGDPGPEGRER